MPTVYFAALLLCLAYCVYCVAGAVRGEDDGDADALAREPEGGPAAALDEAAARERSRLYLARFSEKAKSATRTALLWAAALAIIWTSGLEGLLRDVTNVGRQFAELNHAGQALESQAAVDYLARKEVYEEIRVLTERIQDEQTLKKLTSDLEAAKKSSNQTLAKELGAGIERITKRLASDGLTVDQRKERLKKLQESTKADSLRAKRDANVQKRADLRKASLALREKQQAVAFDVLGQKFQVPAAYASIIWCLLLAGLILYLAHARASLIILAVRALALLRSVESAPPGHLKNIINDAPWWLAPLPPARYELERLAGDAGRGGARLRTRQLLTAFGWRRETHRLFGLSTTACLGLLALAQLRVMWLGLDVSWQRGAGYQRALVAAALAAVMALTAYSVWAWLTPARALESEAGAGAKRTTYPGVLLLLAAGGLSALFALSWRYPALGDIMSRSLGASLSYVTLGLVLAAAIACWHFWVTLKTDGYLTAEDGGAGGEGRRRLLLGALGIVGAAALGFALVRSERDELRKNRPRSATKPRKKRSSAKNETRVALGQGFYRNPKTDIVHYVTAAGVMLGVPPKTPPRLERLVPYEDLSGPLRGGARARGPALPAAAPDSKASPAVDESKSPSAAARGARFGAAPTIPAGGEEAAAPPAAPETVAAADAAPPDRDEDSAGDGQAAPARGSAKPRVNLARASSALEQAALLILQKEELEPRDYDRACEVLFYAIEHDLYLKSSLRQLPSFRLYDLLAGVAVRSGREQYLDRMLALIDASVSGVLFTSRREKWRNPDSSWYKVWRNRKRHARWSGLKL